MDLILMISTLSKGNIAGNEIHILTNKDPTIFQQFLKENLPKMNRLDKYDLKFGLFVYNPDQEIKPNRMSGNSRNWIGG